MIFDKSEIISKSLVQHGPNNDRIYLMKLHPEENVGKLIDHLERLAIQKRYTKIFVKVPERVHQVFLDNKFKVEASIPHFYHGAERGYFLGKYFNARRGFLTKKERKLINEVKEAAIETLSTSDNEMPADYEITTLGEDDIPVIAKIYKQVFKFYPFPIFKEKYLRDTMLSNVRYFGVRHKGQVIAVSSAEMDVDNSNVEMTDFATLLKHRGKNLSYFLLQHMLEQMADEGVKTAYTIARSASYGMNKTFARQGFHFGGTLIKNTLIGNAIESMNVWYQNL